MEKDIGKIPKNPETDIVVRIDDFGGRMGITIREFVTSERYTGFTKAGTRISPENFEKFKELINSIDSNDLKESNVSSQEKLPKSTAEEPKKNTSSAQDVSDIAEEDLM